MSDSPVDRPEPGSPFHDLDAFIALPRPTGLRLSPDGSRLVASVQTLNAAANRHTSAIWELGRTGEVPATRLTRSAEGERPQQFLPDGTLLFTSSRPGPDPDDDAGAPLLWGLPQSGEAYPCARLRGGVDKVVVAQESGAIAVSGLTFVTDDGDEPEVDLRREREKKKVTAILHESLPVRSWDADLGPDRPNLYVGRPAGDGICDLVNIAPDAGSALEDTDFDLSPDGATIATGWNIPESAGRYTGLAIIDVHSRARVVTHDRNHNIRSPRFSPDGSTVVAIREHRFTTSEPSEFRIVLIDPTTGDIEDVTGTWDHAPAAAPVWLPDSSGFLVTADENGRRPVFRFDRGTAEFTRLTADDFAYSEVCVSPDGTTAYALRSSVAEPHRPVRLDTRRADQASSPLRSPAEEPVTPGTVLDVEASAPDGTRIRSWLVLPETASPGAPAPLLVWIHGGPEASWNDWSWRWNPWVAAARGYAVLLPDPAISTGYGLGFQRRGWSDWGSEAFTDVLAATDTALERPDLDGTRTAALGGSFGGYMANWIAGHADRFDAIVTHASLWALDQFALTNDAPGDWLRSRSAAQDRASSPHVSADQITTPVLVTHGDKDYRVPIGEALRLWTDLTSRVPDGEDVPHKFLYFPDENHWVVKPQHAKVWYETVFAFLDHHVQGKPWLRPELLA